MRGSRTISEMQKNIYPKCNLKKDHQKESMNLVCLTATCKMRGPICALCKKQHNGHNVASLKTFIGSIQNLLKKPQELKVISEGQEQTKQQNQNQNQSFKKLQQGFFQVMGMLKLQVLELSDHIQKTEDKFIKQFEQIKAILTNEEQKMQTVEQSLQYCKQKQITDALELRKKIGSILKEVNFNKNESIMNSKVDQIINNYALKVQIYKQNIYNMQSDLQLMFQSIHQKSSIQKIKMNRPKTALPTTGTVISKNFVFSSIFKAPNITLEKDGVIAKLKENQGEKVVFVNNCISAKNYEITVKILDLKGTISLGVALKDRLKQKAFKFQKTGLGHGAFVIASNSLKYNHSDKNQNNLNSHLSLIQGDEVSMSLDLKGKRVLFKCKNDQIRCSQINIKTLAENLWKQLQFCLIFSVGGDKVQIM